MNLLKGLLAILVTLPIWFYLLYKILDAVNASDLMWFLYVVYVPVGIITHVLNEVSKDK